MSGATYRVKVVKPDFEFEAEGDKAFVIQMLERLGGLPVGERPRRETRGGKPPARQRAGISASDKSLSVGEFIRQLGLKRHTDMVLAFGYYLERFTGAQDFTSADINRCYYDAKMESSNTSQMIIQNIKRGRIMEAKRPKGYRGKKGYVLTRTGEEVIQNKLSEKQD